jgi:glycosyltransferase involved in cell wall biosynthesis
MQVRVALNGYFWDRPRTGSGQYLRHLWAAITRLSGTHHAFSGDFTLLLPPGGSAGTAGAEAGRAHTPRPTHRGRLGKLVWEQWTIAGEAGRRGAHILHVPYLSAPVRRPMPVVVTAHDMIPWVLPGYMDGPAVRLYLAVTAAAVRRAELIIADSNASRRDVLRVLKVPDEKVHTVYLGVEQPPDFTADQLDEVRARFGLPRQFAFYIGGFDRRKNVPLLLRAWQKALQSIAVGDGHGGAEAEAETQAPTLAIGGALPRPGGIFPDVLGEARSLGLLGDADAGAGAGAGTQAATAYAPVRLLGPISEADKLALMAAARLFIYPSAYEGFGLDPLAAMAAGCAVVCSSGGSLAEVVGDAGVLVPPGDEVALCDAVVRVWRDRSLCAGLACRGKARSQQFTWERTAQQTLDLYARVYTLRLKERGRKHRT